MFIPQGAILVAFMAATPTMDVPVSALHSVELASVSAEARHALKQFSLLQDWRERAKAADRLATFQGQAVLLVADLAMSTTDQKLLHECYAFLTQRFPKHSATRELVLNQGLNSNAFDVRYMSLFYVGEHRVEEAHEYLLQQLHDPKSEPWFRFVAAKSLAELRDSRSLPLLLQACRNERYMPRYFGNSGLLALTGKNLNDFAGYQYSEGAFVSGGLEAVMLSSNPLDAVETEIKRLTALRDFLQWLQKTHPDLYESMTPKEQ